MKLEKVRWSKVYESSEEELIDLLDALGKKASRKHVDAFEDLGGMSFEQDTTWWCVDGSMQLVFSDVTFSIQAGDCMRIPANNAFSATTGISGCTYYEL